MLNRRVKLIATTLGLAGIGFGIGTRVPEAAAIGTAILIVTALFSIK